MVSGTYVLTDSIDKAFDSIFTDVRKGSTAVITGKSAFDLSEGSGATEPTFSESLLDTVRKVAGRRAGRGKCRRRGAADRRRRQGDRLRRRAQPRLLDRGRGVALQPAHARRRAPGRARGRSWWTNRPPTRRTSRSASRSACRAPARSSSCASRASSASAPSRRSAARRWPASTCRRRSGSSRRKAGSTRSPSPPRRGPRTPQLVANLKDVLPAGTQVKLASEQAESDAEETNRVHHLPPGLPARLRRHRALRRELRDRKLALDHDRAANARVRDRPYPRRLPAPGAFVDRAGGARRRDGGARSSASSPGSLLAKGLFNLFDLVGFTLPNQGLLLETRTIVVSLLVGILVTLLASLRPAIRATRVPPIAAVREGATLPRVALRPLPHRRLARAHCARLRGTRLRPLRERPRDDADPALDGHRRAPDLPRRRALLRAPRAAARQRARLARRPHRRSCRSARPRQRSAQPAADGVDRGGADDRPRPCHARRDARSRDHQHLPRRRRRHLHVRLRDHGAEQLLADPDRRCRGGGEDARRRGDREHADRRGAGCSTRPSS